MNRINYRNAYFFTIFICLLLVVLAYKSNLLGYIYSNKTKQNININEFPILLKNFTAEIYQHKNFQRYLSDYLNFEKTGGEITHSFPILNDFEDSAGAHSGHYFHQDLLVASLINKAYPKRHIDVGSRIDGFVAHVASFRKIEIIDIRELNDTGHKNILFLKADLMNEDNVLENITDSISSLHVLEHFGLGRYGDPIDTVGHIKGFNNIIKMAKIGATIYVSFPIANNNQIHFNAHRVFNPHDIFSWPYKKYKLKLIRFDYVDDEGKLHQNVDLLTEKFKINNGCGIYTFKRIK